MPETRTPRPEVVKLFAKVLADVRQAAGQPSFRQMAQRSGCISHTTLHEAVAGRRLPTWETTEQFLRSCGQHPPAWREQWERAEQLQWMAPSPAEAHECVERGTVTANRGEADARRYAYVLAGMAGAAAVLAAEAAMRYGLRG